MQNTFCTFLIKLQNLMLVVWNLQL